MLRDNKYMDYSLLLAISKRKNQSQREEAMMKKKTLAMNNSALMNASFNSGDDAEQTMISDVEAPTLTRNIFYSSDGVYCY